MERMNELEFKADEWCCVFRGGQWWKRIGRLKVAQIALLLH